MHNRNNVSAYLLLSLSVLLHLAAAASVLAALHALTVRTTLAAIESAFGTLVIAILLLLLARTTWQKGKNKSES